MNLSDRAVWHIESRLGEAFTLGDLAGLCAVSPFHLVRAFRAGAGCAPMAYARARRLSEAARRLAAGRDDILAVALDAGYGSHEAFTRAFASHFGLPPSVVRRSRSLANLTLTEPITMDTSRLVDLPAPRLRDRAAFRVTGLRRAYGPEDAGAIPAQWQAFMARADEVPDPVPGAAYGLCEATDTGEDSGFRYTAGVETAPGRQAPPGLETVAVPAGRYAVFAHSGHITGIRNAYFTIWNRALAAHGLTARRAPDFERYDDRFDPETGNGTVEIWIPID